MDEKTCTVCGKPAELIDEYDEYYCRRCMAKYPAEEQGDCRPL
jgi:predicted amidophosphoribosyltransferase